jgi:hypothetical protein
MATIYDIFCLLDELLCRAGNQSGLDASQLKPIADSGEGCFANDYLGEAHALVQSFMVGTADPSYVKQRLKELISEREGKDGSHRA